MQSPNEDGGWLDEFNKNVIYFDKDDEGNVTALKVDAANSFTKGELASNVLEKMIRENGIGSAMQEYHVLKSDSDSKLIFSERSMNLLGYKFLNEGKYR